MRDRAERLVDLFFEELPDSKDARRAKKRISAALAEAGQGETVEALSARFSSLESLGNLAGYTAEDVARWRGSAGGASLAPSLCRLIGFLAFSLLYWLFIGFGTTFVWDGLDSLASPLLLALCLYLLLTLLYAAYLYRRAASTSLAAKVGIALLLLTILPYGSYAAMSADTFYTQAYIDSVTAVPHTVSSILYHEESGVYTITAARGEFRILHLTDIHLGGSLFTREKDLLALKACYAEIACTRPDLVIVTGDLSFPMGVMSLSFNNAAPVRQFAAFMRNVGVPWAFVFGNHDTERVAGMKAEEICALYESLSYRTSSSLLYPYRQPEITGRNNQLIEVRNADGTLNTALFLLDSNAYTGEGLNAYDYIHDDQVEWYASELARLTASEGAPVSSLAFFHIPLTEYKTAYDLYLAGSEEVTYHFGVNGERTAGRISCSAYKSSLFDRMVELGSTTGVFCGHDHYNNMSLTYRGIRLTYGMSIDYLAMPGIARDTAQRGGELITLRSDSSWSVRQVPLTEISLLDAGV